MMRLSGIAVISAVAYILLKKYSPEYAVLSELCGVALIIWIAFPYVCDIIDFYSEYIESSGINSEYIKIVIKALGIAVIGEFASDICKDSGENAMASKVEFAAKTLILALSIPVAKAVLEFAYGVINRQ